MARAPWPAALLLVVAGCGSADEPGPSRAEDRPTPTRSASTGDPSSDASASPTPTQAPRPGTVVTVGDSQFGQMLFDRRGQAIYLFEPESGGRPACYGECEQAWPPVLTRGPPRGRGGVADDLLGTVRRRDGTRQVTYNGWPLYFYAHEGPGQVLCHDVVLNGGLWLALGPDGRPLPA